MKTSLRNGPGARVALRSFSSGILLSLAFVSCSEKPVQPPSVSSPDKVAIKGSNTIGEELAPRLIAEYKKDHPGAAFDLEAKATGYGIAALLAGQCDLAGASREPLKAEEELAKSRNIELSDHILGSYSVAVVVNAANPIQDLKREQVRDIFTGAVQNWKEVGGPDAPIHLWVRHPISGTYLGFQELAMENKPYASGFKTATNYSGIVQAVAQDPNAVGYSSFDLANREGVKAVSIQGVAPTAAAVHESKYPYARTLHFYSIKASESPVAKGFVDFVQSAHGQEVLAQAGFVPKK